MPAPPHDPSRVTQLLDAIGAGDAHAADQLLPLVYDSLRALARAELAREAPGQTLQPTALVHEAYLRLVGEGHIEWQNRRHFYGAAARAMRRILVDRARQRQALKHGGGRKREALPEDSLVAEPEAQEMLALDGALDRLTARDERWGEIVMLRYFAGLSIEETATAMGLSITTVKDDWMFARAWLRREVQKAGA
ncbi:MAG: sigma-70 family RNA polymerase sigma factor [Phycisphaerae bacterium]|nr:sigma-70 family RNA polymerase sigma factor [Phycisphaerae bacterium]